MRKDVILVRSYAEREPDGSWFAMCVDLNLYARAGSAEAAMQQLNEIVREYVREALEEDREHAEELLNRRAPLGFWLKYYFIVAVCRLCGSRMHEDKRKLLDEQKLPLSPAW